MSFDFSAIDRSIFLSLNGIHNNFFDTVMSGISSLLLWIPLSLFIAFILIRNFKIESKNRLILNILLVLFLAFFQFIICFQLVPILFEGLFQRARPCYDPEVSMFVHLVSDDCGDRFGFFAPRACLAFSVATFLYLSLWEKNKAIKIAFIVWAVLISYSRIYLGIHFPANVLISDLSGIMIGSFLYFVFFYVKNSVLAI